MTKKDFIKLAEYIRDTKNYCEPFTRAQIQHLADFCHSQNPAFKRERWISFIAGEWGCAMNDIRPYGPGKFSTILDSYVYSVSHDGGCDEESGSTDEGMWYGLMRNGRTIFRDHDPLLETLNNAEQVQLTGCAGVIVSENCQGFVYVHYYQTAEQLEEAWGLVLAETPECGQ